MNDPQTDRDEVDANTVANRAAQVISSMGADIRALTGQRDRYRSAWRSARERAQAYGEGILRVVKDREAYQEWLRQAEEPAVSSAVSVTTPPTAQAALRDRIRRAVCEAEGFAWESDMLEPDEYGEVADMVLAVLPPPADRAAVLREAADGFDRHAEQILDGVGDKAVFVAKALRDQAAVWSEAAETLRRLAAETPEPTTQARRRCPACEHFICDGNGPCGAIVSLSAISDEKRCPCTGPATVPAVTLTGKEATS